MYNVYFQRSIVESASFPHPINPFVHLLLSHSHIYGIWIYLQYLIDFQWIDLQTNETDIENPERKHKQKLISYTDNGHVCIYHVSVYVRPSLTRNDTRVRIYI